MKLNRKPTAAEVAVVVAVADVAAVVDVAVVDMAVVEDVVEVVEAEENEEAGRVSRLWFYTSQSFQAINTFENAGFTDEKKSVNPVLFIDPLKNL